MKRDYRRYIGSILEAIGNIKRHLIRGASKVGKNAVIVVAIAALRRDDPAGMLAVTRGPVNGQIGERHEEVRYVPRAAAVVGLEGVLPRRGQELEGHLCPVPAADHCADDGDVGTWSI